MSQLKSKEELAAHVTATADVKPERKQQIVDHLTTMPADRHDAVHSIVVDEVSDDPESKFIYGCFVPPPAPQNNSTEHPGQLPAA